MAFGLIQGLAGYIGANNARKRQEAIDAQARQDALNQQNWLNAYNQRNQDLAKRKEAIDEAGAGVTYDPVTGTAKVNPAAPIPKSLQQIIPNNKGKKAPTAGSIQDLQLQYNHAAGIANYYAGLPGEQNQRMAQSWAARASQIDSILKESQVLSGQMDRELLIQNSENNRERVRENFDTELHGMPTYRDLHPRASSLSIEAAPADPGVMAAASKAIANPPKGMTSAQVASKIIANIYSKPGMNNRVRAATIDAVRALGQQYTQPGAASLLQLVTPPSNQ